MASGIYPQDGVEYAGDTVVFRSMAAEGDVLHEDYMRKMELSLENAALTGAVKGTTLAGWNGYWTEAVSALPSEELSDPTDTESALDATLKQRIYNDVYETLWGVRMRMDGASSWTVAGDSNLFSFVMEDGAAVQAPAGKALEIYVDCGMDNALAAYDVSAGRRIDAFEPGVEYSGVVIRVTDASGEPSGAPSGEAGLPSCHGTKQHIRERCDPSGPRRFFAPETTILRRSLRRSKFPGVERAGCPKKRSLAPIILLLLLLLYLYLFLFLFLFLACGLLSVCLRFASRAPKPQSTVPQGFPGFLRAEEPPRFRTVSAPFFRPRDRFRPKTDAPPSGLPSENITYLTS